MHDYELVYLLDPALSDEETTQHMERFAALLQEQGAEVTDNTKWDRRRLAYPIKKRAEAIYILTKMRAEPKAVSELERQLRLTETVLRHLVVRLDVR